MGYDLIQDLRIILVLNIQKKYLFPYIITINNQQKSIHSLTFRLYALQKVNVGQKYDDLCITQNFSKIIYLLISIF